MHVFLLLVLDIGHAVFLSLTQTFTLSDMPSPKIICVTPVKNEAWILDRFLRCASIWADHIIIADQNSTDGSREIAKRYSKVILIDNHSTVFNEPQRQKLLIEESRKIKGDKILFALDADECLTGNCLHNPEWKTLLKAEPGTIIKLQWVNLSPDMEHCWIPAQERAFGFVDDGKSKHSGRFIHSQRIPIPEQSTALSLKKIKVLHYQYTDWRRMQSKQRWYQMLERINEPSKSSVKIYRRYNHMYTAISKKLSPTKPEWFASYFYHGIDMSSVISPFPYWWDLEAAEFIRCYKPGYFRSLDIWNYPWSILKDDNQLIEDPRLFYEKLLHVWLGKTQPYLGDVPSASRSIYEMLVRKVISLLDRCLSRIF
ncbi:MAG: glycosyltransferase family 2 protein [Bacteroidota bacterium]